MSAGKIAEIDHSPVAKPAEAVVTFRSRPSHDDQVVAGEQLGSAHYDENQAEGEGETAEQPPWSEPERIPTSSRG